MAPIISLLNVDNHCIVAASTLFIYETLATFDREVECFWNTKPTGSALLFFSNKWISMTASVLSLVSFTSIRSNQSCESFVFATHAILCLQLVPWAVFSTLRAYALSRSKLLGILIFALYLVPIGAILVSYSYDLSGKIFASLGCFATGNVPDAIGFGLTIISRAPIIIADALLVYITWTKLDSRRTLTDIRQSKRLTLSDVFLYDGTMNFIVLFILNVVHLILSGTPSLGVIGNGGNYVVVFTNPITSILVSRFLLQLQEANRSVIRVDPDDPLHTSRDPYDAPSFISSLGAFIDPDLPASQDEEGSGDHPDLYADGEDEGRA